MYEGEKEGQQKRDKSILLMQCVGECGPIYCCIRLHCTRVIYDGRQDAKQYRPIKRANIYCVGYHVYVIPASLRELH